MGHAMKAATKYISGGNLDATLANPAKERGYQLGAWHLLFGPDVAHQELKIISELFTGLQIQTLIILELIKGLQIQAWHY